MRYAAEEPALMGWDARTPKAWAKLVALARRKGLDSFVYLNEYEGSYKGNSYVVFATEQITITGVDTSVRIGHAYLMRRDDDDNDAS